MTDWTDPVTGAKGYLAIDKLINGVSGGGIRMREGVTKEEVQRLAHTMTLKLVGLDMPIGGAKAGIDYPSSAPGSQEVLRRFLEAHQPYLLNMWATSEDMGTTKEEIVTITKDLGLHSPVDALFNSLENKEQLVKHLVSALRLKEDGAAITDLVTGYGVAIAALEALKWINVETKLAKISIQGFGSVGASTAKYLYEAGAKVVAVSDVYGTIYAENGLDIALLLKAKDARGTIDRTKLPADYQFEESSYWLAPEVDVLVPAAIADAIHTGNVSQVKAKIIVEGANIPVTEEAEEVLTEKGVYIIPDFIANSTGAGFFGIIVYKNVSPDLTSIFAFLKEHLANTLSSILTIAKEEKCSLRQAAVLLVKEREVMKEGVTK